MIDDLDNKVDRWDHDNLQQQVWELERQLRDLTERLEKLEPSPVYPAPRLDPNSIQCSECGMVWSGVMGYVCQNINCPVQLKVTC